VKILGWVFSVLSAPLRERRVRVLVFLLLTFSVMVATYSTVFHLLMDREGQSHSWATAVYWTLVTMTTLGFGDITFQSDLGRLFSVVVLLSGSVFILVLLPFTFIQFVFAPWMERRNRSRVPNRMPDDLSGHLVLTSLGAIEDELIKRANRAHVPYVVIEPSLETALSYRDRGYNVMLGDVDDPETYRAVGVGRAALVATTRSDPANSNIAFTVREISHEVPIVATANEPAAVDVLELAGADRVMRMGDMLGETLARRVLSPDARCRRIGEVAGLHIAEAPVIGTPLVGQTIGEVNLRSRVGVNVIGVYLRGHFELAVPTTTLETASVLILAGATEQLDAYDELFGLGVEVERPVIIVGGGRVGRAAGAALLASGLEYRIVEQRAERVRDPERYVLGNAADLAVLEQAGIKSTTTVVITTHDDDVNVYLTLYCRRLRPDLQVIARANLDRNVSTLYRAGADSVGSYASTGATAMWNQFRADDTLRVEEDLDVFRVPVPAALAGQTLADCHLRRRTGCNVVALVRNGHARSHPAPNEPLPPEAELILIGDREAETRFLQEFPTPRPKRR
jgi:voltage-gated potassium channel